MNGFIIKDPFPGYCETFLNLDGSVAYTDGERPAQYLARNPGTRLVTLEELKEIEAAYVNSLVTDPVEITAEEFDQALGCLPPARWGVTQGVEMFHISERITADLVSWFCQVGNRYFRFDDRASVDRTYVASKIKGAL